MNNGRFPALTVIVFVLVALAGCGGGSSSDTPSLAGTWSGSWSSTAHAPVVAFVRDLAAGGSNPDVNPPQPLNNALNNATLTIASDGTLSGNIIFSSGATAQSCSASGTVSGNGNANIIYNYSGSSYTATGNFTINATGHLAGTFDEYYGTNRVGSVTIDLARQSSATPQQGDQGGGAQGGS